MQGVVAVERNVLPDGRILAWHRFGTGKRVVVHCHGSNHTGLEAAILGDPQLHGWTVLAPDRPGHGQSDPCPNQSLLEWARDVWVVLRRHRVRRPLVTGWSAGGPHALALAATGDVSGLGLLSCLAPFDRHGAFKGMRLYSRLSAALARNRPRLIRPMGRLYTPIFRHAAGPLLALNKATQPRADREHLVGHAAQVAMQSSRDAYRQGSTGAADDARRYLNSWGFDVADLRVPALFWVGERDRITPPSMSHYLANRMPEAEVRVLPGAGHLLPYGHLASLLAVAGAITRPDRRRQALRS